MMSQLLEHLERFPHPVFSENELYALLSPREAENLMQQGILMVCASEVHGCPFSGACGHACPMCAYPHEDCIEINPFSHEKENATVPCENGMRRYALCLRQFLCVLQSVNGLHGRVHRLDRDGFYLGRRVYGNRRVGFVFLRRMDERELLKLAGLRYLCREDEFLVLLNPVFTIENLFTRHLLHQEHMAQKPLAQCLDPETLEIPLEEIISEFLQSERSEVPRDAVLSKAQASDYQRFEFLCHDRLHFPGTLPTKRSNLIHLNKNALRLGDSLFVLLLYLAVELKKGEGGWVDKITLWEKELVSSPDSYQVYSNLRNTLAGSLLKKDGAAFIQNDGSKRYRISTHPDCISYDKQKLLDHPDLRVKALARELP